MKKFWNVSAKVLRCTLIFFAGFAAGIATMYMDFYRPGIDEGDDKASRAKSCEWR